MHQKQHTVLWRKSLALLSLLALLCFSAANASHIHSEISGSLLQQECVLCVIGGQSPALLGPVPLIAAYLSSIFCLFLLVEQPVLASYRSPGTPRAPPALP